MRGRRHSDVRCVLLYYGADNRGGHYGDMMLQPCNTNVKLWQKLRGLIWVLRKISMVFSFDSLPYSCLIHGEKRHTFRSTTE